MTGSEWTPAAIIAIIGAASALLLHIPPVLAGLKSLLAAIPRPARPSEPTNQVGNTPADPPDLPAH